MVLFCHECGSRLDDDCIFCAECGTQQLDASDNDILPKERVGEIDFDHFESSPRCRTVKPLPSLANKPLPTPPSNGKPLPPPPQKSGADACKKPLPSHPATRSAAHVALPCIDAMGNSTAGRAEDVQSEQEETMKGTHSAPPPPRESDDDLAFLHTPKLTPEGNVELTSIPTEWMALFTDAGVTVDELAHVDTFNFIRDTLLSAMARKNKGREALRGEKKGGRGRRGHGRGRTLRSGSVADGREHSNAIPSEGSLAFPGEAAFRSGDPDHFPSTGERSSPPVQPSQSLAFNKRARPPRPANPPRMYRGRGGGRVALGTGRGTKAGNCESRRSNSGFAQSPVLRRPAAELRATRTTDLSSHIRGATFGATQGQDFPVGHDCAEEPADGAAGPSSELDSFGLSVKCPLCFSSVVVSDPPHSPDHCPSCGFTNAGAGLGSTPTSLQSAYERRVREAKKQHRKSIGVTGMRSVFKKKDRDKAASEIPADKPSNLSLAVLSDGHSKSDASDPSVRLEMKQLEEERKRIEECERDMLRRLEEREKELAKREEKLVAMQHSNAFTLSDFVTKRDLIEVQEKLTKGENPNERNEAGSCLLHIAACSGDVRIMELLINFGASIDAKDAEGRTPIDVAVLNKKKKAVKLLNSCFKHTAFYRRISDSACSDASVLEALDNGLHDVNISWWSKAGVTPLHLAVQFGRWKVVKGIVERDGDVNKPDNKSDTPLHHFVKHYNKYALLDMMEMLMVLLGAGATVEDSYNADGKTPLMLLEGNSAIAKVLSQQNLRAVPNDRLKAWITSQLDLESSWQELRHGLKKEKNGDRSGDARDTRKKCKHMYERYSGLFRTVLFDTTETAHEEMMDDLEGRWVGDMEKCIRRAERVHKTMAKRDADLSRKDVELLNHELRFHQEIIKRCEALEKRMFRFGSSKILWNMRDRVSDTVAAVLVGGAKEGKKHIISGIVKWDYDPNFCVRAHSKMGAIHGAASEGPLVILDYLVTRYKVDVNVKDHAAETPLHYAAKRGRRDVIRALLDYGADPAVRNQEGRTYSDELRIRDLADLVEKTEAHLQEAGKKRKTGKQG